MNDNHTARIAKRFTFDAAHQLPNHDGKCAHLHGHTYHVEVCITGAVKPANGDPDEGMVIDFAHVKAAWKHIEDRVDHRFLNDVLPEGYQPTTAENIARFILDEFAPVPGIESVKLWETPTSYAEVWT